MSPLLFIIKRTLANIVKGLAKKPGILTLYIFLGVLLAGSMAATFLTPGNLNRGDPAVFRILATGVTLIFTYFSVSMGIEKGSSFFRASDVTFVFAGPFRPNEALLYGFIRQLGGMLLAVFIAVFQIPNIRNNFALQPYGVLVILLAVALFALTWPVFGMMVYSFASKSRARKGLAKGLLNGAVVLILLAFVWQLAQNGPMGVSQNGMFDTSNLMRSAQTVFDGDWLFYVPVVGWMRTILVAAVEPIGWPFFASVALQLAVTGAILVYLYRQNLDYYEEVLEATEYREAVRAAKKEGTSMQLAAKARRKVRNGLFGEGASTLFAKNILELRKASYVLFFDMTSFIVIAFALGFSFFFPRGMEYRMVLVLSLAAYMLFIFQNQGRWPMELRMHYIFTMPAKPGEKLFWATASLNVKNLIDGAALFIVAGALGKSPVALIIACTLCYTLMGALFVYADVLARRLFGSIHSKPLRLFLNLFFVLFIITPGIVAAVALGIAARSELASVITLGVWAGVTAGATFLVSAGIFKNIEAGA